jgi:PEGA domain
MKQRARLAMPVLRCAQCKGKSMKRFTIATIFFGSLLARQSFAQSGAVIPQGGAGHAQQATCVILKRMGPADQITSRLYSFGIRGKQFQYVEGKLPDGFPFHGRLTDHDVRNLQARGAEVIVVNQNFTADELKQAREDCRGETGKTPIQADAKAAPSQTSTGAANPPAPASVARAPSPANDEASAEHAGVTFSAAAAQTQLQVTSTPDGADIEIDGSFVGNTPSTVGIAPGQHQLSVKKTGFKPWERKIAVSSGQVNVNAALDPAQ